MDASPAGLDELEEGGVCGWGGIHSVGRHPKILLTLVYHLPQLFEEHVSLNDKL